MNKNYYPINQSPLYKITSHKKLAATLLLPNSETLRKIIAKGNTNYYYSKLESGRKIEVPKQQLSRIHKRINNLLCRIAPPEYLNSGIKKRSNIKNAADHVGVRALLKIDIQKFYPSVTQEQVCRCFTKLFKCTADVAETLSKICCVDGHLPTGSQISQSLSYMVNKPIFDHINIYSKSRNIKFTCYVDDLTFSAESIPKGFCSYITGYIKQNRGYKCHKIRTHNPNTIKSVTGVIIDGNTLKVKNRHRNTIHRLIHIKNFMINRYAPDSPKLIRYFQVLQGHLFSAGQINSGYMAKGYTLVEERQKLGVPALNQNTMA